MKQYFSLKSTFLGLVLLVSGALGLVNTANAFDHHRYNKSSKFYNKGHSNKGYSNRYSNKRYSKNSYYGKKHSNKKYSNKGYSKNRYYGKKRFKQEYSNNHYHGKKYSNKGYSNNRYYGKKYSKKAYNNYHVKKSNRHYSNGHKNYDYGYKHKLKHNYDKSFSREHHSKHQCVNYSVKAIGGLGGFRFQHDVKGFKSFGHEGYSGKICGYNHAEFELSKLDPGVKVALKINGKKFIYGSNSGHDRHINNWHRKYYSVKFSY